MIIKAGKLAKLRECLYGEAKKLVPESITSDFDEAIKTLDKIYGNPIKLLRFRREAFFKLGHMPRDIDKGGFKAQVEWLREAEVILESLYSLGMKNDACGRILFDEETLFEISTAFTTNLWDKLLECPGDDEKERFKSMIKQVGNFRTKAQRRQLASEVALKGGIKPNMEKSTGGAGGSTGSNSGGGKGRGNFTGGFELPALVMFKSSTRTTPGNCPRARKPWSGKRNFRC